MNSLFVIAVFTFSILQLSSVQCFSNFFSEIFEDMRIGSLDKDYLSQKLDNSRLKCVQGAHFFNGSCYFVSNKKYTQTSSIYESDLFLDFLKRADVKNPRIGRTANGLSSLVSTLPTEESWNSAGQACLKLNPDASLIHFKNDFEYEFLKDLLIKLHFPELLDGSQQEPKGQEQKHYIGLTHNNSIWQWINGNNVSSSMITRFDLDKIRYDKYRKCAYLNLRDNGVVNIELTNCNNERQPYVCKYIMDRCFNNTSCGKNGECINVPDKKTFECRCRIFYDGENCETWSTQGFQMLITVSLVLVAFILIIVMKIMNGITFKVTNSSRQTKRLNRFSQLPRHIPRHISVIKTKCNPLPSIINIFRHKLKLSLLVVTSLTTALVFLLAVSAIRTQMIEYKIEQYQNHFIAKESNKSLQNDNLQPEQVIDAPSKFTLILSYDVCKLINDQFFEDYMLIFISFPITVLMYLWNAYKSNKDHEYHCRFAKIRIKRKNREKNLTYHANSSNNSSVSQLSSIEEGVRLNEPASTESTRPINRLTSVPASLCYSCSILCQRLRLDRMRKFSMCTIFGVMCSCSFKLPVPINPFSKRNRFITAVIYAAYTYNILKIFEYLIVGDKHIQESNRLLERAKLLQNQSISNVTSSLLNNVSQFSERGILMDLLKQICNVIIIGLRYYPVLLCVELKRKSKFCYFITSLYVLLLFFSYVYMNIFCLLSASNAIKDANLQYDNSLGNKFSNLGSAYSQAKIFRSMPHSSSAVKNNSIILTTIMPQTRAYFQMKRSVVSINVPSYNKQNRFLLPVQQLQSNQSSGKTQTWSKMNFNNTDFESIKKSLFANNIMYEKFLFYAVLCLITFNIVFDFLQLMWQSIQRQCCRHDSSSKTSLKPKRKSLYKRELNYTKNILKINKLIKPISFMRHLFEKYIYKNRPDFRFPKQFINTQIIAFVLLYYITCIIIRKSQLIVNLSSNLLILLINFIFQSSSDSESSSFVMNSRAQLNVLVKSLFDHIGTDIIIACSLTSAIYLVQLFLGIRNYQRHVLNALKGVYTDIPSPKNFSNTKLASSSLHYSGYAIGYLLWGYLILFEVIVVVIVIIKFLIKFYFITENLAKVILPITTIFLFKRIIIWYLSRFFLTNSKHNFLLRNHKLYFILNHFNFFFDCFLGSFVCFVRMAKSSVAALFFMPRLDYSIFGRFLEQTDMGFISYVTFIHMDVNQSHPIKTAFCEILNITMKKKGQTTVNKAARNKWFVAYTLIHNPSLRKQRKNYVLVLKKFGKAESFDEFLKRYFKIFVSSQDKKQSKSTPNLLDENNNSQAQHVQNLNTYYVYQQTASNVNFRNETVQQMLSDENRHMIHALPIELVGSDSFNSPHYENEQFQHDFLNTSDLTNDTVLNFSTEYDKSLEKQ